MDRYYAYSTVPISVWASFSEIGGDVYSMMHDPTINDPKRCTDTSDPGHFEPKTLLTYQSSDPGHFGMTEVSGHFGTGAEVSAPVPN